MKPIILFDLHEVILKKDLWYMSWHIIKNLYRLDLIWHLVHPATIKKFLGLLKSSRVPEHFAFDLSLLNGNLTTLLPITIDFANQQIIDMDVLLIILQLKKEGYSIYLFSNIGEQTYGHLTRQYPFFNKLFDGHVVSSPTDDWIQKPSYESFVKCINTLNISPTNTLFIDNSWKNIATAKKFGFQTIHFKNAYDLKKNLVTLNIL